MMDEKRYALELAICRRELSSLIEQCQLCNSAGTLVWLPDKKRFDIVLTGGMWAVPGAVTVRRLSRETITCGLTASQWARVADQMLDVKQGQGVAHE